MRRYLLALLGFFFVLTVQAETIPATSGTYEPTLGPWTDNIGKGYSEATVDGLAVKVNDFYFGGRGVYSGATKITKVQYRFNFTYNGTPYTNLFANTVPKCANGGSYSSSTELCTGNTCPTGQNWTLNGSSCTRPDCAAGQTRNGQGICESPCKAGQTRVNGVCQCDNGAQTGTDGTCCPVAGSGGGAPMQWCYVDSINATNCDSAGTNGCKVRCNNVTFQKGTGNTLQIYPKQALGQNCTYTGTRGTDLGGGPLNNDELQEVNKATKDPDKAKTPEGCLAAGMGYIQSSSGTKCVGGGDTGVKQTTTESKSSNNNGQNTTENKTTETQQGPNGETTTKETTTKTNPDGSTTTTTKTTTRNPDGTVTTEETTQQKDPAGNTTGNKKDSNNQTQSAFCKENPDSAICKGMTDECKDHPERMSCMDAGEASAVPDLGTDEKGISAITAINVASNATCPSDIQLPKGMTFSFDPFCNYASALRPIIIALAWITAGFLVFGFRGNGA